MTYIQKLFRYEQAPPIQNYAKRMLLCGTRIWNLYPNGQSDAQLKSELFYNTYIQPYWSGSKYKFYDSDTDFGGSSYDLTPENINAQMGTGYHFVHYAAHGKTDSLCTETNMYVPNHEMQMRNDDALSVFVTMACCTNKFDSSTDPCLSEAFIRHTGGAICYFGSSRDGWGIPNPDINNITLGASFKYNSIFFRSIFNENVVNFAEIAAEAKVAYISSSIVNNSYRWLQYSLNPMGDPELPIYTENPMLFTGITITKNGNNIIVNTNGIDNCTITITSFDDYGDTYFNTQRDVSSAVFTNVPTSYFIVITKHNYVPYIYSSPLYIQREIFADEKIITSASKVFAGKDVTSLKPQGEVIVQPGGKLKIYNAEKVILNSGFKVESGGELIIR